MISRLAAVPAALLSLAILMPVAGAQDGPQDDPRSGGDIDALRALLTDASVLIPNGRCFYYEADGLIVYDDLQKIREGDWQVSAHDNRPQLCHQIADRPPACYELEPVNDYGQILIIEDEARVVRATLMSGNQCGG
jgi:hypothetical protein